MRSSRRSWTATSSPKMSSATSTLVRPMCGLALLAGPPRREAQQAPGRPESEEDVERICGTSGQANRWRESSRGCGLRTAPGRFRDRPPTRTHQVSGDSHNSKARAPRELTPLKPSTCGCAARRAPAAGLTASGGGSGDGERASAARRLLLTSGSRSTGASRAGRLAVEPTELTPYVTPEDERSHIVRPTGAPRRPSATRGARGPRTSRERGRCRPCRGRGRRASPARPRQFPRWRWS